MSHTIIWTEEKKEMAIQKITEFLEEHGPGECIMQSDEGLINAPSVLADIADHILIEGEGLIYNYED